MSCNIGLVTIKALKLVWSLWQQIYNSYIETSQGSLKIDNLRQFEIDIGKIKQYCKIQVKKCESLNMQSFARIPRYVFQKMEECGGRYMFLCKK